MDGTTGAQPHRALIRPARLDAVFRTRLGALADPALDRFAEMVRTVLRVPVALVTLVGSDRQYFPGACGLGEPWLGRRQTPLSHSFCQHVVATAEPLIVTDARNDPRVLDNLAIDDLGVVGYAGMPLTDANGEVLGSLCAIDHEPRDWTDAELRLLAELAASCSDSLRLRISNDRTEAAFDRSRLLLAASTALGAAITPADVTDTVRALVTETLDPASVSLSLTGEISPSPAGEVSPSPAGEVSPSPAGEVGPSPAGEDVGEDGQYTTTLPLPGPDGPVGTLTFVWKQPRPVDEDEQATLDTLAGYVAQTLTRIQLLEDRRTAAATMQKALLTALPQHEHLRMAARYLPAHHEDHVGGDWYDAVSLDGGRLAIVIGDVAGHSIDAAAGMSEYRGMLRTLLIDRHEPPSALLRRLEHTGRTLGLDRIATVLLAYLDPAPTGGHTLTWSNAGHPPPSLVTGGEVTLLTGRDPLLGAGRRISRRNHTWHLPAGSTLVLHTDGLIETRSATIDEGVARLHETLATHAGTDPGELADALLARSAAATIGEDDVALLVITTPDN
ncbi:SpoIIE family protein phosphatase [Actinoplanes sp. M2I2]|uniref:GAF domain-containing SpoIIE family protein phosphatase n=1 Tax=Actinoplanes sp. M2I2 TaxID=1734444 RepID=UPI00202037C4|nr:SpoIIE family protein phosphatase [Actinoplanes sp. M2I2]